jgi:hypothetical protein
MTSPEDMASLSREELLALLAELQRQVAELTASNESLRSEIAESSIALFVQGDSPCHICQGQFLFASISNLISCC